MRALYEELRLRRKHARMIGVGLSVALLLIASFVFIVLKSLPSMSSLRAHYFSSRLHRPISATANAAMPTPTNDSLSGMTMPAAPAPAPAAKPSAPVVSLADYATERFIDRADRTLNVCSQLSNIRQRDPLDVRSFGLALQQEIGGDSNPFADAALAPLGALLQMPTVATVVSQIRDAKDSGDASLLRQAEFYSDVAFAASDVYSNKSTVDQVSNHAYHLSVLARVASIIPNSGTDATLQDLCSVIESRTLTPSVSSAQDDAQETTALLQLLGVFGLTPQQAGFDPALSTQVSVSITPGQVTLSSPWMSQMFGSGLRL